MARVGGKQMTTFTDQAPCVGISKAPTVHITNRLEYNIELGREFIEPEAYTYNYA